MSPNLKHVLVGGGTPVTSSLSRRSLLINNDATRFRVPASFTVDGIVAAEAAYMSALALGNQQERRRPESHPDWILIRQTLTARTPAALAAALDPVVEGLLASVKPGRFGGHTPVGLSRGPLDSSRGIIPRAVQAVVILWRHGCLLAPLAEPRLGLFFGARWLPCNSEIFFGPAVGLLAGFSHESQACINRILLSIGGLQEVGDLSVEVLRLVAEVTRTRDPKMQATVDALVPGLFDYSARWGEKAFRATLNDIASAQRVAYADQPEIAAKVPQTYADVRPERMTTRARLNLARTRDQSFSWVGRDFPSCEEWQPILAEFLKSKTDVLDLRQVMSNLHPGLAAIFASASPPSSPIDACRRARETATILKAAFDAMDAAPVNRNANVSAMRSFFAWVITTMARRPDGTLDPQLGNPADFLPNYGKHTRKAQSDRPKMPGWLIQKAVQVLLQNDYEWPRSRQSDYFEAVEDGQVKQVWSPVLAELALLRFVLPIRGTQARLLGSGEGDTWVWEADVEPRSGARGEGSAMEHALTAGWWVRNTSKWAPPPTEERILGFLRRCWDAEEGTWTNGMYVSTNKTADKVKGFEDLGYEIPWVNAEILAIFDRVRRFQQRYNEAKPPKSRAELSSEAAIINYKVAPLLPQMHYLFRDAAHESHADEPVTASRTVTFWNELIAEVERRCADDPDVPRNPDGSPVQLVERRDKYGRPTTVKYDMHGVRVTGLSRLALGGCPLQVLMMLAGHATFLMTLYYVKMSPGDMRRALDAAEAKLEELDAQDLEEALASMDPEKLRALRFAMSDEGLAQLRDVNEALMASSDLGLCPNGGTLCHIGGRAVHTASGKASVYGAVPGGATNCQSCRFLVTGPQYLGGIVVRLNAQTVKVVAAGDRLREAEVYRRDLVAERRRAGDAATAALHSRVRRASTNVEAAEAHAEDMAERWQNLYRIFNRCFKALLELMQREATDESQGGRHLLVLNGTANDVSCALQKCTDINLWNRVCSDSEVFDSVDATEAGIRRGMRLDHVLAQSGRPAVFAGLTDAERVAVGNAFVRWLATRLGPAGADEIYEGRRTLAEAGLLDDLDMVLPHSAPRPSGTALLPDAQKLLPAATTA